MMVDLIYEFNPVPKIHININLTYNWIAILMAQKTQMKRTSFMSNQYIAPFLT